MVDGWTKSEGFCSDISYEMIHFVRRTGERVLAMPQTEKEAPYNVLNIMRFVLMRLDVMAKAIRPMFPSTEAGTKQMNDDLQANVLQIFEESFLRFDSPPEPDSLLLKAALQHNDLLLNELDGLVTNETHKTQKGRA